MRPAPCICISIRVQVDVRQGLDLEIELLGGGHLNVHVHVLSLGHEAARRSPRLKHGSKPAKARVVEALGGVNPHELVRAHEVHGAGTGVDILDGSDAALGDSGLAAPGEGDAIHGETECLARAGPTALDVGVILLELPLLLGLWKCHMYKQLFTSRLRV